MHKRKDHWKIFWSGTEYAPATGNARIFRFSNGQQQEDNKINGHYAWTVRDGDVAAVPLPAAAWLFGSGLLGLIGFVRRKKQLV